MHIYMAGIDRSREREGEEVSLLKGEYFVRFT